MIYDSILRIKHLPKELSNEEREEFLQHFGAIQVKLVNYPKGKVVAFAKFETPEIARNVLFRLHQSTVLNSRLCVDYSEQEIGEKQPKLIKIEEDDTSQKKCFQNFILKLHSFNHSVGFHQPPAPHLKYDYPKANRPTINNIAHVLATVPKFYTQVLHLMNRMNLPPPFVIENPPVPPKPQIPKPQTPVQHSTPQQQSSSESEIESDGESKSKDIIPEKRIISQKKGLKRPKFIKPNSKQVVPSKIIKSDDVFDKTDLTTINRKIEMKVSGESLDKHEITEEVMLTCEEPDERAFKKGLVITDEYLKSNQIPLKDLGVLPVFKDYHPGVPSNRLYIKNIAKNVTLDDLEYIFNRYKIESTEENPTQFEVKLMQEGRMKGQAFVTLNSVQIAQKALEDTNGFILRDKPLVVVFARILTQKKT